MKRMILIALSSFLLSLKLSVAQPVATVRSNELQRMQQMGEFATTSVQAKDSAEKLGIAADYVRLALVLGLGLLLGRISAVSHRELTEIKTLLTRLAKG